MKFSCSSLLTRVSLLLILFLFCGCATLPHVGHMESKIDDVSAYRNFIMLPVPNHEADPAARTVLGDRVVPVFGAKQLLEERGFQYSDFEEADMLVGLRALYIEPDDVEFTGNAINDLKSTYPGLKSHQVKSGEMMDTASNAFGSTPSWVMIFEVFDKESFQLIWSGWCTTSSKRFFETAENKHLALRLILEDFPN